MTDSRWSRLELQRERESRCGGRRSLQDCGHWECLCGTLNEEDRRTCQHCGESGD
jgi:hypothetical protein